MSILRNWYFVQCSPNDEKAQKMRFDEDLMGQLIRSVAAHEVGHSLGLAHNFGASSTVPVEKLRDREWLETYGLSPSIMDYARFNYVAQPEDNVSRKGLISRIGEYDKWAIEWGYRWYPELKTAEDEIPILNKWVTEKQEDMSLWYGSEFATDDPRTQTEDIGNNAMQAGEYGIKNLKRVMNNILAWTYVENGSYSELTDIYEGVVRQFELYVDHSLANIGGVYQTPKSPSQPGAVFKMVPAQLQRDAIAFARDHVFTPPMWLIDTAVLARVGKSPIRIIGHAQSMALRHLLNSGTFNNIAVSEAMYPDQAIRLIDYIDEIDDAMWTELELNTPIDVYRRTLQQNYLSRIIDLSGKSGNDYRDSAPIMKAKLQEIRKRLRKAAGKNKDPMTEYHLSFLLSQLDEMNNP
jgi:hypothetical protein